MITAHTPRTRAAAVLVAALTLLSLAATPALRAGDKLVPEPQGPDEISPRVLECIERGLAYLARHQEADGSFGKSRRYYIYPTAISSLVGMAFLANGSTPTRGPYAEHLRKITDYLLKFCANESGHLTDYGASEDRSMYSHAFAMMFLAHVYGHEPDETQRGRIREVLRKAVEFSGRTQSYEGGWGYTPTYRSHEGTLTVTQLQGLRSCRNAGIFVPKDIVDDAIEYIESSTNSDGSVRYRPSSSRVRGGVTCAALITLWNAGRYDDPMLKKIADYIRRSVPPQWDIIDGHSEYVMYYLAQARFVLGGKEWPTFFRRYSALLVDIQRSDGSWEGSDEGEIYGTAIALIALQLPYDRLPIYQR